MNLSKEEEEILLIVVLATGGIGGIFAINVPAVADLLVQFGILADQAVVWPVAGQDVGLDWPRLLIAAAILLFTIGGALVITILRIRRRRRLMRVADLL